MNSTLEACNLAKVADQHSIGRSGATADGNLLPVAGQGKVSDLFRCEVGHVLGVCTALIPQLVSWRKKKNKARLENYTFLTRDLRIDRPNEFKGFKDQNLLTFSNSPELALLTIPSRQRRGA